VMAGRSSSVAARRAVAVETFQSAATTIGPIQHGMSLFAITRGQFSMLDALMHVLAEVGKARVSLWTWTVAEYELAQFSRFQECGMITSGLLVIDEGARKKNHALIAGWQASYGPDSVRYVLNHAKIATVETDEFKLLLRGSMNLNFNPRFEQMDLTEGGPDFDLVRQIESDLPLLPDNVSGKRVYAASKVSGAFEQSTLDLFQGVKTWAK
jgi:hypothetical protein